MNVTSRLETCDGNATMEFIMALRAIAFHDCHPQAARVLTGILVFNTVAGTIGNLFVVITIAVNRTLHSPANIFVLFLALSDMAISSLTNPHQVSGIYLGPRFYVSRRPGLCYVFGNICTYICMASSITLTMVSVNRFVCICYPVYYHKLFTRKTMILYTTFILLYSGNANFLTVPFGFGTMAFLSTGTSCVANTSFSMAFLIYHEVCMKYMPIAVVSICNIRIFVTVHKSKSRLRRYASKEGGEAGSTIRRMSGAAITHEIRLAKTLAITVLLLVTCFIPLDLMFWLDTSLRLPWPVYGWALMIHHFNSILNPVIYFAMIPKYRRCLKEVFFGSRSRPVYSTSGLPGTSCSHQSGNTNL